MQCPKCGSFEVLTDESVKAICLDCEYEGTKLIFIPESSALQTYTQFDNTCVSCSESINPLATMCSECLYWYKKED